MIIASTSDRTGREGEQVGLREGRMTPVELIGYLEQGFSNIPSSQSVKMTVCPIVKTEPLDWYPIPVSFPLLG